jgi:hypothetical protein
MDIYDGRGWRSAMRTRRHERDGRWRRKSGARGGHVTRPVGPEGNRAPDLFHAKNEIGGSPFSAFSAAFSFGRDRSHVRGFLVAGGQASTDFACQASSRKRPSTTGVLWIPLSRLYFRHF